MVLCCTRVSIARAQDFRIINMSVSPDKVKDTAELFYMQNQRKISLRYMAWYFLGMDVQVRMCCTSPQCN
jgi:PAB-dependent poly(A)-specific ribonuclease subunit 2